MKTDTMLLLSALESSLATEVVKLVSMALPPQ